MKERKKERKKEREGQKIDRQEIKKVKNVV